MRTITEKILTLTKLGYIAFAIAIVVTFASCSDEATTNTSSIKDGVNLQGSEYFNDLLNGSIISFEFTGTPSNPQSPVFIWRWTLDEKLTAEYGNPIYTVKVKMPWDIDSDDKLDGGFGPCRAYYRYMFEKHPNGEGIYCRRQEFPVDNYGNKILDAPCYDWYDCDAETRPDIMHTTRQAIVIRDGNLHIWGHDINFYGESPTIYHKTSENSYHYERLGFESGKNNMPYPFFYGMEDIKITRK